MSEANIDNALVSVFNNSIVNSLNGTIEGLVERQIEEYEEEKVEEMCGHIDTIRKHVCKIMIEELQAKLSE